MRLTTLVSTLGATGIMPAVFAAPAAPPQSQDTYATDVVDGPPGATGMLYGGDGLRGGAGENTATPTVPATTATGSLVPGQTASAGLGLYLDFTQAQTPQPIRGKDGSTDPGPRNYAYDRINSDLLARPGTDSGALPNLKWPLGLSSNRIVPDNAGWARQENTNQMPVAVAMSGVDMRLEPYAYRELHWHSAGEWSLILRGSVRVMSMNADGENFVDDLVAGDVWFFPSGIPHAIQALSEGAEFLLVFDQGDFSEDGTSLLTEMFLRNPKQVLAKNFRTDVSSFDKLPPDQLYIFHGTPAPSNISESNITGPAGYQTNEGSYTYHLSQQAPYEVPGGNLKIVDPTTFPIAPNFSAALVTVEPGAMREIHWHLTSDEWNFFLQGSARVTVFEAPSSSGTFDFQAGDVGYVPKTQSHYIENVGTENVVFLEVLQAPKFTDISVNQWLGLTPPRVVDDHLHLPANVIASLPKYKPFIIPGSTSHTETNFTVA